MKGEKIEQRNSQSDHVPAISTHLWRIMGTKTEWILSWGITVMCILFLILFLLAYFVPVQKLGGQTIVGYITS